jgi:hypothetical protein
MTEQTEHSSTATFGGRLLVTMRSRCSVTFLHIRHGTDGVRKAAPFKRFNRLKIDLADNPFVLRGMPVLVSLGNADRNPAKYRK